MGINSNLIVLVLLATGLVSGKSNTRLNVEQPVTSGTSSYYGTRAQGLSMANGKPFDRRKLTCASRTYPLGTRLLVLYPRRGTFVAVTVTDRGPWVKGRVLDLSEHAADVLGLRLGFVKIIPLHLSGLSGGHIWQLPSELSAGTITTHRKESHDRFDNRPTALSAQVDADKAGR